MNRIAACVFAALLAAPLTIVPAAAEEAYPSRPITLVVPYAAGGGSDFLGRVLAEGLRTRLNETVVVQNVGGAGSAVGSIQVAKAKPDGYTLLLNHMGLSTIPALYKKLNFDPLHSYEFIGLWAEAPMVILARKEFGPKNFAELVAYARVNKEKFTMASAGMGSSTHLCAMLFQEALGVPITTVQYKGAGPAVIDVRSGQVDAICDLPTTTSSMIRSGDLRAYLLTAPQRMTSLPDVPTATELGMPSLAITSWTGLMVPSGTPKAIIARINAEVANVLRQPDTAERVREQGFDIVANTPAAAQAFMASEVERWGKLVREANIKAD